jgi:hypothetical protein
MRRLVVAAVAAGALLIGSGGAAWADPPDPPGAAALPSGWSIQGGTLTWTAPKRIPMGDAAVEFYAGDRLLGRPRAGTDQRTFRLELGAAGRLGDLQARAGGKRLDAQAPKTLRPKTTPTVPAAAPANAADPGIKGPYRTITGEYSLPGVKLSAYPQPVEMQAVVVAPANAPGKRPLALFLHGRHWTCYAGDDPDAITGDWPCPAGTDAVPSYRGYLQAQELLASQGYVTVSISANGINGQDFADDDGGAQARSSLVRMHLAHWADWAGSGRSIAPAIVRAVPRADMSRVFLMGHSRGGEGVSRAAMDSLNPPAAQDDFHGKVRWTIRGMLLIGPTIFGQNPTPDVPSATILPGCDGDVADLQGQMFVDATRGVSKGKALHSALYVIGANHNYFNTEWTPGQAVGPAFDDFYSDEPDPLCTPGTAPTRLTPQQEQNVGATYIAAAARLFVGGDDRVRPLLDGSGVRAPSADPARVLTHAIGAARTPVIVPDTSLKLRGARLCTEVTDVAADACLVSDNFYGGAPHFVSFGGAVPEPGRYAVALNGTAPVTMQPAEPISVAGSPALALRLIVPPNSANDSFRVAVTDDHGRRSDLGTVTLNGVPGTQWTSSYWGQEVRVPLGRQVRTVAKLELTPLTDGPAWLIDAWGWRPGTPAPQPAALPRIDIGQLSVDEGDSGTKSYQVPVSIKGHGYGKVRLFLTDPATFTTKSWLADIRPSTRTIKVPVEVTGNTTYGADKRYSVAAKAVRNTVVGDYDGGVDVREDDPMPTITITPAEATVTEGGSLTWTVHLSEAADDFLYLIFLPQAPATGPELSTTDVDATWFSDNSGEDPEPSRALSGTALQPFIAVEPGTTSTQFTVPTVADGVAEPAEHVAFQALVFPADFGDPIPVTVIDGTVSD